MISNWNERSQITIRIEEQQENLRYFTKRLGVTWGEILRDGLKGGIPISKADICNLVILNAHSYLAEDILKNADLQETIQKNMDLLIDIAIEAKSHECYILLVEYKQKNNLYQEPNWSL